MNKSTEKGSDRELIRYECDQCERTTSQFQDTVVYCDSAAQHRRKRMRLMVPVLDGKSG